MLVRSSQRPGMNRSTFDTTYFPSCALVTDGFTDAPCPCDGIHGTSAIERPSRGPFASRIVSSMLHVPRGGGCDGEVRTSTRRPPSLVATAYGSRGKSAFGVGAELHAASSVAKRMRFTADLYGTS